MQIFFINNAGGGFADLMQCRDGLTVGELFDQQMPNCEPHDYLIRVNRQPCPSSQVLEPDDRVSITPTKIDGAEKQSIPSHHKHMIRHGGANREAYQGANTIVHTRCPDRLIRGG